MKGSDSACARWRSRSGPWAHNLRVGSVQQFGHAMNHSVDRRRLCLIPKPASKEREEEDQGHRASCDETRDDKLTFEKMQIRILNSSLAKACALMKCRARQKNVRQVFCLQRRGSSVDSGTAPRNANPGGHTNLAAHVGNSSIVRWSQCAAQTSCSDVSSRVGRQTPHTTSYTTPSSSC